MRRLLVSVYSTPSQRLLRCPLLKPLAEGLGGWTSGRGHPLEFKVQGAKRNLQNQGLGLYDLTSYNFA